MATLTLELKNGRTHDVIMCGDITAPSILNALRVAANSSGLRLLVGYLDASEIYYHGHTHVDGGHKAYLN